MPTATEPMEVLLHGTTRQRALAILQQGPDPDFVEPGGYEKAGGFSTSRPTGSYPVGSPTTYALGKARLFPNEGGAVLLEVEVPESIVRLAIDVGGEVRFQPADGLEELLDAWPGLPKRILPP